MCGGYGNEDSNKDGDVNLADFFRDITDGGGEGRSGARFSSGDTGGLDQNQDNYISEQEYQRGQSNSESNADSNITGEIGDAYNNSMGFVSNFSNKFGALPRGSIRQEAALGPEYGSKIETKNAARFLQGGGYLGAIGRGLTGGNIMSPDYVAPEMGEMTPEQYDRALVQSFNSMGNTGEQTVPPDVAAAMGRLRGLRGGVDTSSPAAVDKVEAMAMARPAVVADDEPQYEVVLENGMYNIYQNGQLVEKMTEQEFLMNQNKIV